jgi:hypothetical protein
MLWTWEFVSNLAEWLDKIWITHRLSKGYRIAEK